MQFSKQLLILSDFFFCLLCVIRRLCVFLETFFFCAMAIALLGVLIIVIFI